MLVNMLAVYYDTLMSKSMDIFSVHVFLEVKLP